MAELPFLQLVPNPSQAMAQLVLCVYETLPVWLDLPGFACPGTWQTRASQSLFWEDFFVLVVCSFFFSGA